MRTDRRFSLTLACFFLSGFAALLFQTAWTREFAFVFGTSDLAVATVLAGYMAGLAIGAAAAGRFARVVRRPVLVYAVLELAIGAAALLVPLAIQGTLALARRLFGGLAELPEQGDPLQAAFYLGVSLAILVVPTSLMGATLPLLARDAVRLDSQVGPRVGALYAMNTVGAVAGTLVAGFFLLPSIGLRRTVWAGAAINLVVFVLAARISRVASAPVEAARAPATPAAAPPAPSGPALVLPIMLASGAASFGYEVLWTRLLGHLVGGSVYAFATMLASFLTGIALGSAYAARRTSSRLAAARGLAAAQLGIALLAMAAGIGADYGIYFLYRLREERTRAPSDGEALRAAMETSGRAVVFVATSIGAGFAALGLFSDFFGLRLFGTLMPIAMVISCLAALSIMPVLVLRTRPAFLLGNPADAAPRATARPAVP